MKQIKVLIDQELLLCAGNPDGSTVFILSIYPESEGEKTPFAEMTVASSSPQKNGDVKSVIWERRIINSGEKIEIIIGAGSEEGLSSPIETFTTASKQKEEEEYKYYLKLKERFGA